jgi:hypothetical protein
MQQIFNKPCFIANRPQETGDRRIQLHLQQFSAIAHHVHV